MNKALFAELLQSLGQAEDIRRRRLVPARVRVYHAVDVKRIRSGLHVSQRQFAMLIGVSTATLQNWEQGRREPEGPAKALLSVVEKEPAAVLKALHAG